MPSAPSKKGSGLAAANGLGRRNHHRRSRVAAFTKMEFEGGSPVDTPDSEQSEGSESEIEYLLTDVAKLVVFKMWGCAKGRWFEVALPFEFKSLEVCLESALRASRK
ncbi:hypothetical protein Scep_025778 [Stephania cephalantha]|uniref:Uncharacterized protein n=1 Tax=Stephania cephalantha TaxID=152367 RepID=A0AAP0EJB5_9MAGN